MSSAVKRALRAMDGENLEACGHGLREAVDTARLAGNTGMAAWFDALGALVDAERDRRAGRPRGATPALSDRLAGLTHGELLALAMQATLDPPPVDTAPVRALLAALATMLNGECRRRVAAGPGDEA